MSVQLVNGVPVVWRPLTPAYLDPLDVARFVRRVDITRGMRGCWLWQGAPDVNGYGRTARFGTNVGAHRFALEIDLGRPVADDMFACHTCDTRLCVNPAHLYEGTPADNNRDTRERSTFRPRRPGADRASPGARNDRVRLSEADIRGIRSAGPDWPTSTLALRFGVSESTVWRIRAGRTWAHIR